MNKTLRLLLLTGLTALVCASCDKTAPNYAIQSIPSIDEVLQEAPDLIAEMGPYLHFGDNPPKIDSFSINAIELLHFIHNTDHPEIPYDTNTMYYRRDGEVYETKVTFKFNDQHRGVYPSCSFERAYGELGLGSYLFEDANTNADIFIMGNNDDFTIYYKQSMQRRIEPSNSLLGANLTGGLSLIRIESVIISGTKIGDGITNFHWGFRVEQYEEGDASASFQIGKQLPAIHDMFHFIEHQP